MSTIDPGTGTDEVEGLDDAPVIELALPEFMKAVALGIEELDGLDDIHELYWSGSPAPRDLHLLPQQE